MSCEGPITSEECREILETFQNNKSPGNNWIPIEFYKSCWDLICESFMNCINESFEKGEMPYPQRQAVITLIEKRGKDRTLIENWRPILKRLLTVGISFLAPSSPIMLLSLATYTYSAQFFNAWNNNCLEESFRNSDCSHQSNGVMCEVNPKV